MIKKYLFCIALAVLSLTATAQDYENMYIHLNEATVVKVPISSTDSINFYSEAPVESAVFTNAAQLAQLSSSIQNSVGNVSSKEYTISDFTARYGWKGASKAVGTSVVYTSLSQYSCIQIPVTTGDYIIINTAGADACRAYYIVDKNNKILELPAVSDGKTLQTFTLSITDTTAAYLLVNCNTSTYKPTENVKIQQYSGISGLMSILLNGQSAKSSTSSSSEAGTLSGLTFLGFGDSVAAGAKSNKVTYLDMVAEIIGGTVLKSYAVAGKRLSEIRSQVETAIKQSYRPDVVFLEGGLNDMCGTNEESGGTDFYTVETFETNGIGMGNFDPYDYTVPDGTRTSLTAQVEYIMYTVKKNYTSAIPMWVLTHRTAKRDAELQEKVYDRIIECAKKWNVAVIDVFHEGALSGELYELHPGMTDGTSGGVGGTHPTAAGYKKYYVPLIIDALNKYCKKYE